MTEKVLFAVHSWSPSSDDGGVFVALPVACSDCTIRVTEMPFPNCDPFQRGLLMFLLAGVSNTIELADLLGITDVAFIDLMASELEYRGLLRIDRRRQLVLTQEAIDIYRSAPGTTTRQTFGRVLYRHDGKRGYVLAGPLNPQARVETIDPDEDRLGTISVGTEGRPSHMKCVMPAIPQERPAPIASDDAQQGLAAFVNHHGDRALISPGAPRGHFTVALEEPRWERLLVRVLPESERRRGGKSAKSVLIGERIRSAHALKWLERVERSDSQLKGTLLRELRSPGRNTSLEVMLPGPDERASDVRSEAIDDRKAEPRTVVDIGIAAQLTRALCNRVAVASRGRHIPLVGDRLTNEMTIRERFRCLGFTTTNEAGDDFSLPHIPDSVITHLREGDWQSIEHLWASFCAWVLTEDDDEARSLASYLPDLPSQVIEAQSVPYEVHRDDFTFALENIQSTQEEVA